jgi:hypothetical protein
VEGQGVLTPPCGSFNFTAGLATVNVNGFELVSSPNLTTSSYLLPFNASFTGVFDPYLTLSYYSQGSYIAPALYLADIQTALGWNGTLTLTYDYTPATPLPAALPLFATGLAGLGLLGWRRKRKAQVAIA